MHPIYSAALRRPDLLADHATNYIALAKYEVAQTVHGLVVRAVAGVIAAVALLLALGFTGVAVMLGALHGFAWALVLVPGTALLFAIGGVVIATRSGIAEPVKELKNQFDADLAAMRLAGGTHE